MPTMYVSPYPHRDWHDNTMELISRPSSIDAVDFLNFGHTCFDASAVQLSKYLLGTIFFKSLTKFVTGKKMSRL